MKKKLTHFNASGDAHMVAVGDKEITARAAVAEGWISMDENTLSLLSAAHNKKGDALGVARLAAIMGAKRTAELIPLCHPIQLTNIKIDFDIDKKNLRVHCTAEVASHNRTGVEMEALNAVQIALLTIYDMCKSADRMMTIEKVQLVKKTGGRSGHWTRATK